MNLEAQLKVQAWLDGELGQADVPEVLRLVREDPEAAALARGLKLSRQWLAAGEPARPVPESREFYWSGMARKLAAPGDAGGEPEPPRRWWFWLRWLAPVGALAVLVAMLLPPPEASPHSAGVRPAEVDTPLDDVGSFTFRSDSEQMTVVWVTSF
jgi:hypothetical protein